MDARSSNTRDRYGTPRNRCAPSTIRRGPHGRGPDELAVLRVDGEALDPLDIDITRLLRDSVDGSRDGFDQLYAYVYEELRALARAHRRRHAAGQTLSTTVLTHELYLRMVDQTHATWEDRARFFGYAARVLRTILVDHARARGAKRRGGDLVQVTLGELNVGVEEQAQLLLEVDQALRRLATVDARMCRVVECRFFGQMTEAETAAALGVTERTIRRDWTKARAWLHMELGDAPWMDSATRADHGGKGDGHAH